MFPISAGEEPHSTSNQLGVIIDAFGSKERYSGMTSGETYKRPASPITASKKDSSFDFSFCRRAKDLVITHDPINIRY